MARQDSLVLRDLGSSVFFGSGFLGAGAPRFCDEKKDLISDIVALIQQIEESRD